ncbi:MAG: hypothetical protein SF187_27820 [Deltaproteobacteria bacterium]|nr:hypothetical protein [Deltaproteobacteria bacterium]
MTAIVCLAFGVSACDTQTAQVFGTGARDCTLPITQASLSSMTIQDARGRATVVASGTSCQRTYTLATTAPVRVGLGEQVGTSRVVAERQGDPFVRTGNVYFDALYTLALAELRDLEVNFASGPASGNTPVSCGAEGCYKTGDAWPWVWTRNSGYAIDLAGPALDLVRAQNTLLFKLSSRANGQPGRTVVEDLGTGGGYPLSIDRATWALGARRLLALLQGEARQRFSLLAKAALVETVMQDRANAFDQTLGLYRGETTFLNGREQSYPAWMSSEPTQVAGSYALSTNVLQLQALESAVALAQEHGDILTAQTLAAWAKALRLALATRFENQAGGVGAFIPSLVDPAPVGRTDLLGLALAIEAGVWPIEEGRARLSAYPQGPVGAPVIWPQSRNVPVFHNRAVWPFVLGHALRAARIVGHDAFADNSLIALFRAAALNVSNVECFDFLTGDPRPPILSGRQELWSAAAYLSMVQESLFGFELSEGAVRFRPYVTANVHRTLFSGTRTLALGDLHYRGHRLSIVIDLPPLDPTVQGAYQIAAVTVNGVLVGDRPLAAAEFAPRNRIVIRLTAPASAPRPPSMPLPTSIDDTFAPATPSITNVVTRGNWLEVEFAKPPENPSLIRYDLRRDGALIARDLPADTAQFVDTSAPGEAAASHCYVVEARFIRNGLRSHPSAPVCFWGTVQRSRVHQVSVQDLLATGGQRSTVRTSAGTIAVLDRWGAPEDEILYPAFVAPASGQHMFQIVASNGAGPVDTGVACAVKDLIVERASDGARVGGAVVVVAQRGRWDWLTPSTFAVAELERGVTYSIRVKEALQTFNMSQLAHYADYTEDGGTDVPSNRLSISELRILTRVALP